MMQGQLWQPCNATGCENEPVCVTCEYCESQCSCSDQETVAHEAIDDLLAALESGDIELKNAQDRSRAAILAADKVRLAIESAEVGDRTVFDFFERLPRKLVLTGGVRAGLGKPEALYGTSAEISRWSDELWTHYAERDGRSEAAWMILREIVGEDSFVYGHKSFHHIAAKLGQETLVEFARETQPLVQDDNFSGGGEYYLAAAKKLGLAVTLLTRDTVTSVDETLAALAYRVPDEERTDWHFRLYRSSDGTLYARRYGKWLNVTEALTAPMAHPVVVNPMDGSNYVYARIVGFDRDTYSPTTQLLWSDGRRVIRGCKDKLARDASGRNVTFDVDVTDVPQEQIDAMRAVIIAEGRESKRLGQIDEIKKRLGWRKLAVPFEVYKLEAPAAEGGAGLQVRAGVLHGQEGQMLPVWLGDWAWGSFSAYGDGEAEEEKRIFGNEKDANEWRGQMRARDSS